jgi:hypothetical protein
LELVRLGTQATASGSAEASRKDVKVNGVINASNVTLVKAQSGTPLP